MNRALKRNIGKILRPLFPRNRRGDKAYMTVKFFRAHKRLPRNPPVSWNDHVFQMLVGDELLNPLRQTTSDKYLLKEYVAAQVGKEYVIETLALLENEEDLSRFSVEQVPCVLKPTHLSAAVVFVRDKDAELPRAEMTRWLRMNYYDRSREINYRNLKSRILVEPFLSSNSGDVPDDYKVFCIDGDPKFVQVDRGRFSGHTRSLYTPDWELLPFTYLYPSAGAVPQPPFLAEMLSVSKRLSAELSFIRVDFLAPGNRIRVAELTNCPEAGVGTFDPREYDDRLGGLLRGKSLDEVLAEPAGTRS